MLNEQRLHYLVQNIRSEEDIHGACKGHPLCDLVHEIESGRTTHATVILFKPTGKYYTEELWRIPENAIGPYDMVRSPDFRRISGGPVLVVTQEPWGYPHLLLPATDGTKR